MSVVLTVVAVIEHFHFHLSLSQPPRFFQETVSTSNGFPVTILAGLNTLRLLCEHWESTRFRLIAHLITKCRSGCEKYPNSYKQQHENQVSHRQWDSCTAWSISHSTKPGLAGNFVRSNVDIHEFSTWYRSSWDVSKTVQRGCRFELSLVCCCRSNRPYVVSLSWFGLVLMQKHLLGTSSFAVCSMQNSSQPSQKKCSGSDFCLCKLPFGSIFCLYFLCFLMPFLEFESGLAM